MSTYELDGIGVLCTLEPSVAKAKAPFFSFDNKIFVGIIIIVIVIMLAAIAYFVYRFAMGSAAEAEAADAAKIVQELETAAEAVSAAKERADAQARVDALAHAEAKAKTKALAKEHASAQAEAQATTQEARVALQEARQKHAALQAQAQKATEPKAPTSVPTQKTAAIQLPVPAKAPLQAKAQAQPSIQEKLANMANIISSAEADDKDECHRQENFLLEMKRQRETLSKESTNLGQRLMKMVEDDELEELSDIDEEPEPQVVETIPRSKGLVFDSDSEDEGEDEIPDAGIEGLKNVLGI